MRPSQLKMTSTHNHCSLVLVFLVFNPGDLYYLEYSWWAKKIIIINVFA